MGDGPDRPVHCLDQTDVPSIITIIPFCNTTNMSAGVGMNSCCLSGKVQEGKPTGKEEEINGMQTYVAAPENGDKSKTIVFLVDS